MSYLAPSLIVILECSRLSRRTIENLFMNSRDRLADEELAHEILDELADVIKTQPGLRLLRERRRQEDIAGKIADEKPLQDVLEQILKRSPALAQIFLAGTRLSNPFASAEAPVAARFDGTGRSSGERARSCGRRWPRLAFRRLTSSSPTRWHAVR
jgi:hypothetical protein